MAQVFISYAREDENFVLRLAQDLRQRGIDFWLDQFDIVAGIRWDDQIQGALNACSKLLIILSPTSVKSQNVKDEISFALDEGKTIIPIFYQETTIPFRLRRFQYIDFRDDYVTALSNLLEVLPVSRASEPKDGTGRPAATIRTGPAASPRQSRRPRTRGTETTITNKIVKRLLPWLGFAFGLIALLAAVGLVTVPILGDEGEPVSGVTPLASVAPLTATSALPATPTLLPTTPAPSPTTPAPATPTPLPATPAPAPTTPAPPPTITALPTRPVPSPTPPPSPLDIATQSLRWISIPAGTFTMGSSETDMQATLAECNESEGRQTGQPCQIGWFHEAQKRVSVNNFEMTRHEITNAQYNACVNAGVCQPAGRRISDDNIPFDPIFFADAYPVVGVTWHDANTFCQWIGGRLPTGQEWEWAARGDDGRRYPWGNRFAPSLANLSSSGPAPAGSYPDGASPHGLLDMAGNVFEWTATSSNGNYVLRGGGWNNYYFRGRVTDPGTQLAADFANYDIGFRCAR